MEDDAAAAVNAGLVTYSRSSGNLFFNENGIAVGFGSGGQFATLQGKPGLTTDSFKLVA